MKIRRTTGVLALIVASGALWALPQTGLQRVPPDASASLDRDKWLPALTDDDLDRREQAYADLIDLARTNPELRDTLSEWAEDESAPLFAWTSRLALRELEAAPPAERRAPHGFFGRGPASPFEGDPFFERFFDGFGADPFEHLEDSLDRLHRRLGPRTPFQAPQLGPGFHGRSDGFSMQMGPDGVKVQVRELVDGEEQVRHYEAESLDALLEANPELEPYVGSTRNPNTWFGRDLGPAPRALSPRDRHVLGVLAETRAEGGLVIAQVLPGTIADDLGLVVDEVVLEIGGREIRTHADVRDALAAIGDDEPVVVTIEDVVGRRRDLTWTPR